MSLKVHIFILWLSIFISSHSAADTHSVVISKATPNLKIKHLNPDGLYGASWRAQFDYKPPFGTAGLKMNRPISTRLWSNSICHLTRAKNCHE